MDMATADQFVAGLGAGGIAHPGGTLLAHLRRVRELLAEWGCGSIVQTAGLCHAIYGTDGFDTALLDLTQRPRAQAAIGAQVEEIVYRYASCDRAAMYPNLDAERPVMLNRFTARRVLLSPQQAAEFALITAANELDVVCHSAPMAAKHGLALSKLMERANRHLPEPASTAWADWTATHLGPVTRL